MTPSIFSRHAQGTHFRLFQTLAPSVPALSWRGARAQVASLLGSEFGLALPPTLVFDFPTLESLAMYLASSLQVCLQRQLAALLFDSVTHGGIMVIRAMMPGFGNVPQDVGTVDPDIRRRSSFARTFARGRKGSLADVFRRCAQLMVPMQL